MKTTTAILAILMSTMLIGFAQPPRGPFMIMNYINLKGENEYLMMTNAEVQERYRIVRQEKAVFTRALRSAEIEWSNEQTLRFPRIFKAPELIRLKVESQHKNALRTLNKYIEKEEERIAIQERNEEKKAMERKRREQRSRYNGGGGNTGRTAEEFYAKQRENHEKAYQVLRDKMDELLGKGDTAHSKRLNPQDVFNAGRPK